MHWLLARVVISRLFGVSIRQLQRGTSWRPSVSPTSGPLASPAVTQKACVSPHSVDPALRPSLGEGPPCAPGREPAPAALGSSASHTGETPVFLAWLQKHSHKANTRLNWEGSGGSSLISRLEHPSHNSMKSPFTRPEREPWAHRGENPDAARSSAGSAQLPPRLACGEDEAQSSWEGGDLRPKGPRPTTLPEAGARRVPA